MKFQCTQSKVIIEFMDQQDIDSTLANPAYVEYKEPTKVASKAAPKKESTKEKE